jgi:O-acetyl-ADP-ribose deacetylase (regulator of RNase III)
MITKYVKGSILDTELKYIAHGVNCQNKMGSGVAKVLFDAYPEVKSQYHEHCKTELNFGSTPKDALGTVRLVYVGNDRYVANCFTQEFYGYDGKRYVNYFAVADCFYKLAEVWKGQILAIPKIGCGLAGGDWNFMEQLINDTVGDKLEIWVYEI